jgi:ATP-dependent DNA helicase RecG
MDVEQDAGEITPPVTPPVMRLLNLLAAKGPKGNADIREEFGLKDRAHLRKLYIDPALSTGLIEYTIPDKPTSRMQKYQLSDKGRTWLTAIQERQAMS